MSERQLLLKRVQVLGFCMHEAALFLDSNPRDEQALEYYAKHRDLYEVAQDEYVRRFGPISVQQTDVSKKWQWVEGPWPWELEED